MEAMTAMKVTERMMLGESEVSGGTVANGNSVAQGRKKLDERTWGM